MGTQFKNRQAESPLQRFPPIAMALGSADGPCHIHLHDNCRVTAFQCPELLSLALYNTGCLSWTPICFLTGSPYASADLGLPCLMNLLLSLFQIWPAGAPSNWLMAFVILYLKLTSKSSVLYFCPWPPAVGWQAPNILGCIKACCGIHLQGFEHI